VGRVPARGEILKHSSVLEFEIIDSDARRIKAGAHPGEIA